MSQSVDAATQSQSAAFDAAAIQAKSLKTLPSNDDLLELYGLYKQATLGNIGADNKRPGIFEPTARAKWDAWNTKKDLTKEEAETQYIALVNRLNA